MIAFQNLPATLIVNFGPDSAGLTTVGYTLKNPDGTTSPPPAAPRSEVGVVDAGEGLYTVAWTPADSWMGYVKWDRGVGDTLPPAYEDVLVLENPGALDEGVGGGNQNYIPSVSQVARKIMSRTRDRYGQIQGTFSDTTDVTAAQVTDIIRDVVVYIADEIGDQVPTEMIDDTQNVVAERAAMQIELNFFTDQVNTGRSIYPQLEKQYEVGLARLRKALTEYQSTGTIGDVGQSSRPSYNFPTAPTQSIDTRRF